MRVREDLRTRLGWGLVYEIVTLDDADKPAALIGYARQRGFHLSDEVVRYLLAHGRRDMTTLLATLVALDRRSLSAKRPITVPLLRALGCSAKSASMIPAETRRAPNRVRRPFVAVVTSLSTVPTRER